MRLYSVEEARAMLPRVIPVLEQVRDAFLHLRAFQAAAGADARGATGDGNLLANPWADRGENQVEVHNESLRRAAALLDGWGIEVKDPEKGLIDFRHERHGEVVCLCYMLGEPDISYWHTPQAGFAGRQPL